MTQPQPQGSSIFEKKLTALYIISFLSGFSMGIFNPLISLEMDKRACGNFTIGANHTLYYVVIALCAPFASWMIRRYGIRKALIVGLFIVGVTAPMFPITTNLPVWFLIRTLMGLGVGLYMIGGQTGVNEFADEKRRGLITSMHATFFGVGFAVSPIVGTQLYQMFPLAAFTVGGVMVMSGILVVLFMLPDTHHADHSPAPSKGLWKTISLPLHAVFLYGAFEGILVSMYPVYLSGVGFDESQIGYALTIVMVGSGVGMVPISWLADHVGRGKTLFIMGVFGLIALLCMTMVTVKWVVFVAAGVIGLAIGPMFPVTLAFVGELVDRKQQAGGSALFTALFSYGCAAGPLIAAGSMNLFGDAHLFMIVSLLLVVLIFRTVKFFGKRDAPAGVPS